MCQDSHEFVHEWNPRQRLDILSLHWNVKHPLPVAEIPNIDLFPIQANSRCIRVDLWQVEQMANTKS